MLGRARLVTRNKGLTRYAILARKLSNIFIVQGIRSAGHDRWLGTAEGRAKRRAGRQEGGKGGGGLGKVIEEGRDLDTVVWRKSPEI